MSVVRACDALFGRIWVKAVALLSLPTAVSRAFRGSDLFGDFVCGWCRLHHNDDVVSTRPVCSIELLTTFCAVSKLLHLDRDRRTVTSLISRDLIVVSTVGRARIRLDFLGGLRQLLLAEITEQQAVWCGRHSIVLRQVVNVVESSHGR